MAIPTYQAFHKDDSGANTFLKNVSSNVAVFATIARPFNLNEPVSMTAVSVGAGSPTKLSEYVGEELAIAWWSIPSSSLAIGNSAVTITGNSALASFEWYAWQFSNIGITTPFVRAVYQEQANSSPNWNWISPYDIELNSVAFSIAAATSTTGANNSSSVDSLWVNSLDIDKDTIGHRVASYRTTNSRADNITPTLTLVTSEKGLQSAAVFYNSTWYQPVITAANTTVRVGANAVSITTTNAGATSANVFVGSTQQTTNAWSDSAITYKVNLGNETFGVKDLYIVTSIGAQSNNFSVSLLPSSNSDYTNINYASVPGSNILQNLLPGYQVQWGAVTGAGAISVGINGVLVYDNGSYTKDAWVTGFDIRIHNGSSWSSNSTITAAGAPATESGHYFLTVPGYLPSDKVYMDVIKTFNANSSVNNSADFISVANNPFINGDRVLYYTDSGNTVLTGLSNAAYYYVIGANTTGLRLSTTAGGSNVDITANAGSSGAATNGHNIKAVANSIIDGVFTEGSNTFVRVSSAETTPPAPGYVLYSYSNPYVSGTVSNVELISVTATAKAIVKAISNSTYFTAERITFENTFVQGEDVTGDSSGASSVIVNVMDDADEIFPIGLNADIEANVVTANGQVVTLQIIDSGFGYTNNEVVQFVSEDGTREGTAKVVVDGAGVGKGYYRTTRGFLSDDVYIHDGDYYQEYSYEIFSRVSFDNYAEMFKKVMHMAGTKFFGSVSITEKDETTAVLSEITNGIEIDFNSQTDVVSFTDYINIDITQDLKYLESSFSVNATADFIYIANNTFSDDDIVLYYSLNGTTPITGLTNNQVYYVVNSNSSGVSLSLTSGGAKVDIG